MKEGRRLALKPVNPRVRRPGQFQKLAKLLFAGFWKRRGRDAEVFRKSVMRAALLEVCES